MIAKRCGGTVCMRDMEEGWISQNAALTTKDGVGATDSQINRVWRRYEDLYQCKARCEYWLRWHRAPEWRKKYGEEVIAKVEG